MTAPEGKPTAAEGRPRPARRGPADLDLSFADEATVRSTAGAAAEPDWLLADRLEGLRLYQALPMESNQLYTGYVDLRNAQLAEARPLAKGAAPVRKPAADASLLPEGASAYVELDGQGVKSLVVGEEARAAGVVLETLAGLRARDPKLARSLLEGGCMLPENDKLAALTRAFWSAGLFVHVPDGATLAAPIVLRWVAGEAGSAVLSRTIVSLGEGARASIVEEQVCIECDSPGEAQALFAGTTEIALAAGSALSFAGLQDFDQRHIAFQHRSARVGEGATLRWALAQLGGRIVRSRIDNRLEGDRSTVEQAEIIFGSSDQLFDLTSYTHHLGRDTTGNLLSKGALGDRSRAYLKGLITIDRSAIGTDSYLGEFGLLLSRQARSVAIPSLEIDQPDCRRAQHASSVGPMDETAVFYLASRGLDLEEAHKLIVMGYLEPVVARVSLPSIQERLRDLLAAKWDKRSAAVDAADA